MAVLDINSGDKTIIQKKHVRGFLKEGGLVTPGEESFNKKSLEDVNPDEKSRLWYKIVYVGAPLLRTYVHLGFREYEEEIRIKSSILQRSQKTGGNHAMKNYK